MLGIIVMGHGKFGSGISSTLRLIGGEQDAYAYLDFSEDKDMDMLLEELREQAAGMTECERIAILCDLDGGTPFKTALLYSFEKEGIDVISGISFPFLLELSLSRGSTEDVDVLLEETLARAREGMQRFDKGKLLEQLQ